MSLRVNEAGNLVRTAAGNIAECIFRGDDCDKCTIPVSRVLTVTLTGAVTSEECKFGFFFEGLYGHYKHLGLDASFVNGVGVECVQDEFDSCRWQGGIDVPEYTIELYISESEEPDCSVLFSTETSTRLEYDYNISGTFPPTRSKLFIRTGFSGGETYGGIILPSVCGCTSQELLFSVAQLWDFDNGHLSVTGRLCEPLHLNSWVAVAQSCSPPSPGQQVRGTAIIHDENHDPVEGVTVAAQASGLDTATASGTTDINGIAVLDFTCFCDIGDVTVTIQDIAKDGKRWESGDDEDGLDETVTMSCS